MGQDVEDKERRRIMQEEQDKIEAMKKEMEREKKALELDRQQKKKEDEERRRKIKKEEQQKKEEEARRKELEKRRKLKELEEEKEAEMERQRKKNNHEWDINCKGNAVKVNGKTVTGSNKYATIWIKGVVSNGSHEWRFKLIKAEYVRIGITNEKNEKKKNSELKTLYYNSYSGFLYDAAGKKTKTNGQPKKNDILSIKLNLNKNQLTFLLNGKQIGNAMTVKNGSYRAAVTLYYSSDCIELL